MLPVNKDMHEALAELAEDGLTCRLAASEVGRKFPEASQQCQRSSFDMHMKSVRQIQEHVDHRV